MFVKDPLQQPHTFYVSEFEDETDAPACTCNSSVDDKDNVLHHAHCKVVGYFMSL